MAVDSQNWLIRHILDPYQITKDDFKILLRYLMGLEVLVWRELNVQGNSKSLVLDICKKAKEAISPNNEQPTDALERIQLSRVTVLTSMFEGKWIVCSKQEANLKVITTSLNFPISVASRFGIVKNSSWGIPLSRFRINAELTGGKEVGNTFGCLRIRSDGGRRLVGMNDFVGHE